MHRFSVNTTPFPVRDFNIPWIFICLKSVRTNSLGHQGPVTVMTLVSSDYNHFIDKVIAMIDSNNI